MKRTSDLEIIKKRYVAAQSEYDELVAKTRPEALAMVLEAEDQGQDSQSFRKKLNEVDEDVQLAAGLKWYLLTKLRETAVDGSDAKVRELPKLKWRWCVGVEQIAEFIGCNIADVADFIRSWIGFPAHRVDNIWICKKSRMKAWLKDRRPYITKIDWGSSARFQKKETKIQRRKHRW